MSRPVPAFAVDESTPSGRGDDVQDTVVLKVPRYHFALPKLVMLVWECNDRLWFAKALLEMGGFPHVIVRRDADKPKGRYSTGASFRCQFF